jgi:hypothetical protein
MRSITAILAYIALTFGVTAYFICYQLKLMNADKLDNLFFYSISAGISLISYSLIGYLGEVIDYLMRASCLYFAYLFIIFGIDDLFYIDLNTFKWVILPTGGLLLCLGLSALWHWGRSQHST